MNISIVIPTYNRPFLLDRLLNSISCQTHKDFEIIIVNDFSKNLIEYQEIIEKYNKVFKDLRYIILKKNTGAPACRNIGILLAKNDWIALVDDDDEWTNNKLDAQVKAIVSNKVDKNTGIIYSYANSMGSNNKFQYRFGEKKRKKIKSQILEACFIPSPTVMVNREAIIKSGLFDLTLRSCQDWDMWIRMIHYGYKIHMVEQVLAIYHNHDEDRIGNHKNANVGYIQLYRKHFKKLVLYIRVKRIFHLFKLLVNVRTK